MSGGPVGALASLSGKHEEGWCHTAAPRGSDAAKPDEHYMSDLLTGLCLTLAVQHGRRSAQQLTEQILSLGPER